MLVSELVKKFQTELWKQEKPLDFCVAVVETLFEEQLRTFTVFREAEEFMKAAGYDESNDRLVYLMECLSGEKDGVFLSHLSDEQREEYNERLKKKVTFGDIYE